MGDSAARVSFRSSGVLFQREGLRERVYTLARWGLLGGVGSIPVVMWLGPPAAWLVWLFFVGVPALWVLWLLLPLTSWSSPASVSVEQEALTIAVKRKTPRALPLASLKAGWVAQEEVLAAAPSPERPTRPQHLVEIETGSGDVFKINVASAREGRKLLRAAGLDARRRSLRLQLGPTDFLSAMFALALTAMSSLPVSFARSVGLPWWAGIYGGIALFVLGRRLFEAFVEPAFLTIGADGVLIEQSLSRVFVSFRDVAAWAVDDERDTVTFQTHDGRTLRARARLLRLGRGAQVRDRLAQAIRVFEKSEAIEDEAKASLQRGSQSVQQWRQALARVADVNYRSAAVSREQLWALLQDPQEEAETRLGAALALRQGEREPDAEARIRVAAESCAAPRLRVALASAADDALDDRALEEALLEESEAAGRAG